MKRQKLILILVSLISLILIMFSIPASAQTVKDQQVVRVGFYDDGDYMSRNENGDYTGFNFEYLQEVAKYTGWKYEIVDGESWDNTLKMIQSGEIDILPAVYYTDERAAMFSFASQPMCGIYVTLNVRPDDSRYDYEDFAAFNGMKVGVIKGSEDGNSFSAYCKEKGIDVAVVPFAETNDLLSALDSGRVDAAAITHLGRNSTYRSVAQFSPQPIYTVVSQDKPELLTQLNNALNTIKLRNPHFDARLYDKYFSVSSDQQPVFTAEEREFIEQSGSIAAVYDPTWAPLEYMDEAGKFAGVVADLFSSISKSSGLKFHFMPGENMTDSLDMLKDPNINVICGTTSDYLWNSKNDLNTTQPFLTCAVAQVKGNNSAQIKKIALQSGYTLAETIEADHPDADLIYFDSPQACFDALLSGHADTTYVNTYIANYLLSDTKYSAFTAVALSNYTEEMSIGVSNYTDPRLFSILDKCIQYTATEQVDELILKNTISTVSWQDFVRQHPLEIISGTVLFFLIVTILLAFLLVMKSKSRKKIENLLYTDGLTGIWNLQKFRIEAQKLIKDAGSGSYAVLYVDFKQFRTINDTFGFKEGDRILCSFANILKTSITGDECCARVSADQFVVLLRYTEWEQIEKRTSEIDEKTNEWVLNQRKHYHLNLVFGVYVVDDTSQQDISLMMDFASYANRSSASIHKSTAVLYDEQMRKEELSHRELADRMQSALKNDEFVVYYQPKVDMPTQRLVGSEALVRWEHPQKGLLPPGMFIPFFEKNGFVTEIDLYIYEQVCKALHNWIEAGLKVYPVSCNFSRLHFKNQDFPRQLVEIAARYNVPHKYLELEVTESAFVGNLEQGLEHFSKLKHLGFPISIDDFGSGYSSLGLLQQFAVDVIKLDRSFIQQGMRGKKEQAVVRSVIQMARALDMDVICEGVEEPEQANILMEMGCYTAQGYYYAKPMPQSSFEERLQRRE